MKPTENVNETVFDSIDAAESGAVSAGGSDETSASSYFDLRVEGFELGACVVDCELPIDTSLPVVAGSGPGIRFCSKFVDIYDAAILQALTRHGAEFVL